ncbi:hypothetical protein K439DRAFT_1612206 [Ramaria rubella]|nr:hypothetical protein K439DRAFT_1612206 [Ramaria rubella]
MFEVESQEDNLVNRTVPLKDLAAEAQKWTDRFQRIKSDNNHFGYSPDEDSFQALLLDLSEIFFILLYNNRASHTQLHIADLEKFLDRLIDGFLTIGWSSWTATQEKCVSLIAFLAWMTASQETLLQESSERRESILATFQAFTLPPAMASALSLQVDSGSCPQSHHLNIYMTSSGLRLSVRTPSLRAVSQLCTGARYKCMRTARTLEKLSSDGCDYSRTSCAKITPYHCFEDDRKRYVSSDYTMVGSHVSLDHTVVGGHVCSPEVAFGCGYAIGTFQGLWEGSFFIPSVISHLPNADIFICQKAMQYHLHEYHAVDTNDVGFLMIYDPGKSRWLRYHPSSLVTDAQRIVDTIMVGLSAAVPGSVYGEFKIHGRVRRHDGLVALVRQPVFTTLDSLGRWIFHGHVHGGRDLVGDWRVTCRATYSPGEQGWFMLTKADPENGPS